MTLTLGGTVLSSCLLLAIHVLATVQPLVTNCSINISSFESVREIFEEYRMDSTTRVVKFETSGVNWSDSSNETYKVFDPNWWSWAAENSEILTQLPIDYSILSFGFSRITMTDMPVRFVDIPSGCAQELAFKHQRALAMREILRLTEIHQASNEIPIFPITNTKQDEEDLICLSVYPQQSLVSWRTIGVGMLCCTRRELQQSTYAECNGKTQNDLRHWEYAVKSAIISIIGFILPFVIVPIAIAWWLYNPMSMSYNLTIDEYLSERYEKWAHFDITSAKQHYADIICQCNMQPVGRMEHVENNSDSQAGKTLVIALNELEPYEGAVSLRELLHFHMFRMHRRLLSKIKLTLLVLFQFIPVVSWIAYYNYKSETLRRLDTAKKILFNLRNNPYSWLWTDESLWPHTFASVLVFLNFFVIVLVIAWWLLELPFMRRFLSTCRQLRCRNYVMLDRDNGVKKAFKIFFCIVVICSYVSVYSLFNSIIFVIGGLIVSIDLVSPWLTGVILVFYYAHRSYAELVETYTKIKQIMFEYCENHQAYQAKQKYTTVDVMSVDKDKKLIKQTDTNMVWVKDISFKGPVWFIRDSKDQQHFESQTSQDEQAPECKINVGVEQHIEKTQPRPLTIPVMLKASMSKATLYKICNSIKPVKQAMTKAAVKLVFTLLFIALVVFIINVFRPNEAGVLITSLATLFTALIPRLADMMGTQAESKLNKAVLKFDIKNLLKAHSTDFKVIDRIETSDVVSVGEGQNPPGDNATDKTRRQRQSTIVTKVKDEPETKGVETKTKGVGDGDLEANLGGVPPLDSSTDKPRRQRQVVFTIATVWMRMKALASRFRKENDDWRTPFIKNEVYESQSTSVV